MTDRAEDPLDNNSRRVLLKVLAAVTIVSLLSMTVVANGYALQNVGVFLGVLPASMAVSGYSGMTMFDGLANFVKEAYAAKPTSNSAAANLDQCTNGGVGKTEEPCKIGGTYSNWVNGNSNGQKSHWKEGEFISYRTTITGLSAGAHTLKIQYDTVHGGKHAIDYLGSFDATETTGSPFGNHANMNDPCNDKFICTPSNPPATAIFLIPDADLDNCAGSEGDAPEQAEGFVKGFASAGTLSITGFTYVDENLQAGQGQCTTSAVIAFSTTASSTVILAWGGHIASEADSEIAAPLSGWGAGHSASFISGSPYHMALKMLDTATTGSQDRALSTSAVIFEPTIVTDILDEDGNSLPKNGDNQVITLTASGPVTVKDSATLEQASSNAGGTVTYFFYETIDCTGTEQEISTVNVVNKVVPNSATKEISESGEYSFKAVYDGDGKNLDAESACEPLEVSPPPAGDITIRKDTVPNDDTEFDFTASTGLSPDTFKLLDDGSGAGNEVAFLDAGTGTYTVTETPNSHYRTTVSCEDPDEGSTTEDNVATIDLDQGEHITCTFTNEKLGTISWVKQDNAEQPLAGATFEVCQTHEYNSDTQGFDLLPDEKCFDVLDNAIGVDEDSDDGEFMVIDLIFGKYTVHEKTAPSGYAVDPDTEVVEIVPGDQDQTITAAFVDERPIVKITAFGYENAASEESPTHGITSGTTMYSITVHNYGGAAAEVDIDLVISAPDGLGGGSLKYGGSIGGTGVTEQAIDSPCTCTVSWDDQSLAINGDLTFTVTIAYENMGDGKAIQADLTASYGTRDASGSGASIIFHVQAD